MDMVMLSFYLLIGIPAILQTVAAFGIWTDKNQETLKMKYPILMTIGFICEILLFRHFSRFVDTEYYFRYALMSSRIGRILVLSIIDVVFIAVTCVMAFFLAIKPIAGLYKWFSKSIIVIWLVWLIPYAYYACMVLSLLSGGRLYMYFQYR